MALTNAINNPNHSSTKVQLLVTLQLVQTGRAGEQAGHWQCEKVKYEYERLAHMISYLCSTKNI